MWRFDRLRAETRSAVGGPMSGELEDRGQGQPFDGLRAGGGAEGAEKEQEGEQPCSH